MGGDAPEAMQSCPWPCQNLSFPAAGRGAEERGYHVRAVRAALPQPHVQRPENGKSRILQGWEGEGQTMAVTALGQGGRE